MQFGLCPLLLPAHVHPSDAHSSHPCSQCVWKRASAHTPQPAPLPDRHTHTYTSACARTHTHTCAHMHTHLLDRHGRDLLEALRDLGRVVRAQLILTPDVAPVVQQQLGVGHTVRRLRGRHVLEHELVAQPHNLLQASSMRSQCVPVYVPVCVCAPTHTLRARVPRVSQAPVPSCKVCTQHNVHTTTPTMCSVHAMPPHIVYAHEACNHYY